MVLPRGWGFEEDTALPGEASLGVSAKRVRSRTGQFGPGPKASARRGLSRAAGAARPSVRRRRSNLLELGLVEDLVLLAAVFGMSASQLPAHAAVQVLEAAARDPLEAGDRVAVFLAHRDFRSHRSIPLVEVAGDLKTSSRPISLRNSSRSTIIASASRRTRPFASRRKASKTI